MKTMLAVIALAAPVLIAGPSFASDPCGCDSTANNEQINLGSGVIQKNVQLGFTYSNNTQYNEGDWVKQINVQKRFSYSR